MKKIIECSSIYAIDFAAVIYNIINDFSDEYILFINDAADTTSEYRRFISRLALPTLEWEIDPQGQLRQVHIPIENLQKETFIKAVGQAFESYNVISGMACQGIFFDKLKQVLYETTSEYSDKGIELYKKLIQLIIELTTGKKILITNFADIRVKGDLKHAKAFLKDIYDDILNLPSGAFKFIKGGKIEMYISGKWISITNFNKQEQIQFYGNDGLIYSFEKLQTAKKIRFRGPLETVFLCQYGILIDLPWYLDADISDKADFKYVGEEYISPISVSSVNRASKQVKGKGKRLVPSGYSLIEYESDKVLRVLEKIYKKNEKIQIEDLKDWKNLVNNYPLVSQKIAKSQTSVHEFCNVLIDCKFKQIVNGRVLKKLVYKNYVTLGENLVDCCILMKVLRLISNRKSPYYCKLACFNNFYLSEKRECCLNDLYVDLLLIVNKCIDFFSAFNYNIEIALECKYFLEKSERIFQSMFLKSEHMFGDDEFYHIVSKIEGKLKRCIYIYYELATFISGVLLKANIFSGYCLLGEEYNICIKKIMAQRKIKKLYFKPIYIEGV